VLEGKAEVVLGVDEKLERHENKPLYILIESVSHAILLGI
jgi:hypothetical protein